MEVKEESEKVGLKLNIQKIKIMASGPITSWQIDGETKETVRDFILGVSKIPADGDCSHEIRRCLFLGRKAMTNLDSISKSRDISLPAKVLLVRAMVFLVVIYGCESWTIKKAEHRRIDAFELWCWRRLLRVPWTTRKSNQSILKEISLKYSLEGLMLKLKLQYFGQLTWRTDSLEKPWCWERLNAGGEGDDRGWDGWIASPTQWTWVWVSSRSWWWTGKPGVLQSMGSQRVGHDWAIELNWTGLYLLEVSHCSVAKLCLTLCNPMDCSMPGFPVPHHLPEFAQVHVLWVGDAIQPFHPLSPSSPSAFNVSQHQGLDARNGLAVCIRWPKCWNFSFNISPSNKYSGLISFKIDWFDLFAVQESLKSLLQNHSSKASVFQHSVFFLLPGESQGWGSLVGFCLWGRTESDITEATY